MRTIIIAITLIIIAILSIPLYLVTYIIGLFRPSKKHAFAQKIVSIVFRFWLWISGTDYTIYGLEKVPKDEPVLYIANHRSYFDIILSYAYVPTMTSYVSKDLLKKFPCIAQWMYFLKCMFLNRDDLKSGLQMIKDSISLINNEKLSIYIAPEGTRNPTDTLLPFKEGSFKIATRTNCKIVPVCYTNTENILETHAPWIKKATVTMEFGEPIDITNMSRDEKKTLGVKVRDIIQEMYDERRNTTHD